MAFVMEKNEATNPLHLGSFSPQTILFKTNLVLETFHESHNKVPFAFSNIPFKKRSISLITMENGLNYTRNYPKFRITNTTFGPPKLSYEQ